MIPSPCFKGRKEPKRTTKKTKKARGVRRERRGDEKVEGGSAKEKKEKRKEGGKRCPHPHDLEYPCVSRNRPSLLGVDHAERGKVMIDTTFPTSQDIKP